MTIRVLIADDQEIVRTGLTMILDAQPDIEVVGEAADGREAVDARPPAATRRVPVRHPHARASTASRPPASSPDPTSTTRCAVVVITTFDLDEYVHGALKAGARGSC